jgi:putative ABC transport system permease protein
LVNRTGAIDDLLRALTGARKAMSLMAGLLWVVAAMIVGSMIYMSALERTRDFAVFKAVGVPTRSILAGLAMQAVIVAVLSALLGGVLSVLLGPLFPMRVDIPQLAFILLPVVAITIGVLASLAGLRRAVVVDPAMAFGGP